MGTLKTPPHHLVVELRRQMDRNRISTDDLIAMSGLARGTICGWFYAGTVPSLDTFSKAVAAAGGTLIIDAPRTEVTNEQAE